MKVFPKALISFPIIGAIATLAATPSFAAILSTGPAVTEISPPSSVKANKKQSNDTIYLFQERENFSLPRQVSVDITSPEKYSQKKPLTPGIIPAYVPVDSYFLHVDPIGTLHSITLSGSVTFDEEILGLIVLNRNHNDSKNLLGNPGTDYPNQNAKLEFSANSVDSVEWLENRLDVTLRASSSRDQIRVITEHSVAPTFDRFLLNGRNSNLTIFEGDSVSALLYGTDPNRDAISFFLNDGFIGTDFRESGTRLRSTNLGVFEDETTVTYRGRVRDEDGKYSNSILEQSLSTTLHQLSLA